MASPFIPSGRDGFLDEPRPGAPRRIKNNNVELVVAKTLDAVYADVMHWSMCAMAQATGLSATAANRF